MARASLAIGPISRSIEEERRVQVLVRDNNVDQALKVLKKKMQREGVFREMKLHGHYEKPSERRVREKAEAIRRARKLARKKLQREGLLPMKPRTIPGAPGRGGPARIPRFLIPWNTRTASKVATAVKGGRDSETYASSMTIPLAGNPMRGMAFETSMQ